VNRTQNRDGATGSASVLVLGAAAFILVLALGAVTVVTVALARQRAETAGDLAALAGAAAWQRAEDPCSRAEAVAQAQAAILLQCHLDGDEITVLAQVPVGGWLSPWVGAGVRASARAGPAR